MCTRGKKTLCASDKSQFSSCGCSLARHAVVIGNLCCLCRKWDPVLRCSHWQRGCSSTREDDLCKSPAYLLRPVQGQLTKLPACVACCWQIFIWRAMQAFTKDGHCKKIEKIILFCIEEEREEINAHEEEGDLFACRCTSMCCTKPWRWSPPGLPDY